jgi:patatin-like phospholipase/acyl hydrolase
LKKKEQILCRILSIDGGGIRGIIPGMILSRLEEQLQVMSGSQKRLAEYFDLISGTSTGGILTCIYTCPDESEPTKSRYSAREAVDLYLENGGEIFHRSFWQKIGRAGGYLNEKYPSTGLERALSEKIQDLELKQLIKPCLITSYEINRRYAHFFTQHNAREDEAYNFKVRDVARATSAAPTYFEAARIRSNTNDIYTLVDGGVFANNPALCAYAEARRMKFEYIDENPTAAGMFILSLGTGSYEKPITYEKTRRWGAVRWIKPLIDIMMSGVSETVHYQLGQIFDSVGCRDQYIRIDPELSEAIDMDDASPNNLEILKKIGLATAEKNKTKLEKVARLLIEQKINLESKYYG